MSVGTLYPFPNVPEAPGVPALNRAVNSAIAASPVISLVGGSLEILLINALQQPSKWGIYDQDGNQLGINPNSQTILQAVGGALLTQLTGSSGPILSTNDFTFTRDVRISDYPIEQGKFASYNKALTPASPLVTLILNGQESDRTNFLEAIEDACQSTELFSVVTPEIVYTGYSIERYTYSRKAQRGATLLIVEVSLKEIRTVRATFTTASTPINAPQNAAATPAESNGITQPATPDNSTLLNLMNQIKSAWTTNISPMFSGGGT